MTAIHEGFQQFKTDGRRPTYAYIPRFRNLYRQETDFLRGYAATFAAFRSLQINSDGVGERLLDNLLAQKQHGPWRVGSTMMGETIPKISNQVRLSENQKDAWGVPLLQIDFSYDENDEKMLADFKEQLTEMFERAGLSEINFEDTRRNPGNDIHEMGGVRMGHDPKTSLLNQFNQMHACPNVYVTDGACMTSVSTQNPSLTFMALTARAANYAMRQGQLS